MRIVFASNYLNHHQLPFCSAMQMQQGVEFSFVATAPVPKDRRTLGYSDMNRAYDFVVRAYESKKTQKKAKELCEMCDVLVIGSAPYRYANGRKDRNKVTFFYSERLFKGNNTLKNLCRLIKHRARNVFYQNNYLLCASAFTSADYARCGAFSNRTYKWGYFPETKRYNVEELFAKKQNEIPTILWVGRFLELKHPDDAVRMAKQLKQDGYRFELNFIGTGKLEPQLERMIQGYNLEDCVRLLGAMPPEQVREYMEQANIYLFTSDGNEGWGAVLNESMNSGCAVVASHAIGSVPFLMKNGENGLIYESGNVDMLCEKVKWLLDCPEEQTRLGKTAYWTITETWSAPKAAERFIKLAQRILDGEKHPYPFEDGPCSKAERLLMW